ncbi:HalOD1 output domain-containing protein [Halorubrum sp. LN27]|uniref:HalOD1 output domain-containing protein n=1 Tax=Halorubrum sp. LN27 TaxID=2801032 RepID=UPI001909C532|nr:HalOD1 output domain-containing protein [Halorubrum sp. LN27]
MSSAPAEPRGHGANSGAVPETVRVEHGDDGPAPSRAVVEAVAGAAGVEPVDLADEAGIVLYDHVDLDALDALVASRHGGDIDVTLSVAGYEVTVDATAVVAERAR